MTEQYGRFGVVARCAGISVMGLLFMPVVLRAQDEPPPTPTSITAPVNVSVDTNKAGNFLAPRALGVQASIYDPDMLNANVPDLLRAAGTLTLRYPGGRASDQNHWSVNNRYDWRHPVDFGSFVKLVDKVGGTMVLAVDYGSNLKGDGPGEPAEAAAWVAYVNGKADDPKAIGKDSAGNDWKTVGYWATMRSSAPLARDDGYNFLRIGHPQQLNVKYWEVGSDVSSNGYYARDNGGAEIDHHGPYDADAKKNPALRLKNAGLGPLSYGQGVSLFAKAMKAVDGRISVGVSLDMPTAETDWNGIALKACAADVDFVVLHWYAGNYAPPDYKNLNDADFLAASTNLLPKIVGALVEQMKAAAPGKALQLAVTEMTVRQYINVPNPSVMGLFAADIYASLAEDGAVNIDWAEMHSPYFLTAKDSAPQPAFFGVEMLHKMMNMRDTFVTAKSSTPFLSVHAAKRADGNIGLMFINKDPKNTATVKVKINGDNLAKAGTRFDWGVNVAASGNQVQTSQVESLGNSFTITVPAYNVTDLVIPIAK